MAFFHGLLAHETVLLIEPKVCWRGAGHFEVTTGHRTVLNFHIVAADSLDGPGLRETRLDIENRDRPLLIDRSGKTPVARRQGTSIRRMLPAVQDHLAVGTIRLRGERGFLAAIFAPGINLCEAVCTPNFRCSKSVRVDIDHKVNFDIGLDAGCRQVALRGDAEAMSSRELVVHENVELSDLPCGS